LSSQISGYNIYGNISNNISGANINTSTGIALTNGTGYKNIIMQMYANNYFATHFVEQILLDAMISPTVVLTSNVGAYFSGTSFIVT
jgi:hypothetical protein